jgi:hypothetical protein
MEMATNCEDVSAQMMDLLYGELSAEARARIDAHVAGCDRCRSELEGFEKTRAAARQVLDEAPPVRARVAILKAAAAHLAAQPQVQAQPARKPAAPERTSFWDRMRVRWALPTFATIGAVAVFAIANRVFLNPERTLEHVHEAVQAPGAAPATPPAAPVAEEAAKQEGARMAGGEAKPAPAAAEPFGETAQQGARFKKGKKELAPADDYGGLAKDGAGTGAIRSAAKPSSHAAKTTRDDSLEGLLDATSPRSKSAPAADKEKAYGDQPRARAQFAPPPPPRETTTAAKKGKVADKAPAAEAYDNPLESVESGSASPRRTAPAKAPAPAQTKALDDLGRGEPEAARGGGSANGPGALGGPAGGKNKADGFGSGAGQAERAPVGRNETATRKPAPVAAPPPAATMPAPAAPPPPPAPAAAPPKARAKPSSVADDEAAEESDAKMEKKQSAGKSSATEALVQRADRLFAEGRWSEAAAAYRELLRRDPRSDEADRWRRRVVTAENADVSERNASVAEKRAAEAKSPRKAAPPAKAAKRSTDKEAAGDAVLDR